MIRTDNEMVNTEFGRSFRNDVERAQGIAPQSMRFGFSRLVELQIGDVTRLPVASNTTVLQRASDGKFYFLPGWSQVGGPDIPGP